MKRGILITLMLAFVACVSVFAQPRMPRPMTFGVNFSKYEKVDSLPLERIYVHTNTEDIEDENAVSLGGGDYMFKLPFENWLVIKTNAERTTAIVTSFALGMRFMEYNVEENDRRLILWYKDSRRYCGLIYDKEFKVCQYFTETPRNFRRMLRPHR